MNTKKADLSAKENKVLMLIYEGLKTSEIAEKLLITKDTVNFHRKNILRKTNSKTLVDLVKYVIKNNVKSI